MPKCYKRRRAHSRKRITVCRKLKNKKHRKH